MSSSMVYCQCNFCGTPPGASAINSFVIPLQSTATLAPLCTNGCINVSAKALTKTNVAPERVKTTREAETFRQQEQLAFGIDRILYGSSKAGKSSTSFNFRTSKGRPFCSEIIGSLLYNIIGRQSDVKKAIHTCKP